MNNSLWNEMPPFDLSSVIQKLKDCLQTNDADMRPEAPFALAAIAYWRKLIALRLMTAEERDRCVRDDDTQKYLTDYSARYEEAIQQATASLSVEELQAVILDKKSENPRRRELPPSAARLVLRMLEVREGESLLCVGTGFSSFLEETCLSFPNVRLTVFLENQSLCRILNIRAAVMGWPLEALEGDIFSQASDNFHADKIFLDAALPTRLAERAERLREQLEINPALREYFPDTKLHPTESGAWMSLVAALSKQAPGGKTVGLMFERDLKESRMASCRERLVREGRLEAVVALPKDLDRCHSICPYILSCGEGNTGVRMVDASDVHASIEPTPPKGAVGYKQIAYKTLTSENIETILRRLQQDGERSRLSSPEELATRGFSLLPDADYLKNEDFYHNHPGVPLSDICRIYRGAVALSGKTLENCFSEMPTPFQYLQLKDVQGGLIQGPLPYLQSIEKKQTGYCAKNGVLVMGKNAPLRVGILELPENTQVLLGGNIYAMEVTSAKYDPVYVMAYLQSADGMRQLNLFLNGNTAVQIISIKDLGNIKIPSRPLDEQRAVAKKYQELFMKMKTLLFKAKQIKEELEVLPE